MLHRNDTRPMPVRCRGDYHWTMMTMPVSSQSFSSHSDTPNSPRYSVIVSADPDHRTAAQRLRYRVFNEEPGFTLPDDGSGVDHDRFDALCDHLLVRDNTSGQFIGCYRMLPASVAARHGYYTAMEFDISALDPITRGVVEMGRACVLAEHRNGAVLSLMWAGILHYLQLTGSRWAMGCVSIPMRRSPTEEPGANVRAVRDVVLSRHATELDCRAYPYRPVTVSGRGLDELPSSLRAELPPLLRGYLRLGARVCGEPGYDPEMDVADFVALLCTDDADQRYVRRLQRAAATFGDRL
jgi:putative hemolysin